MNRYLGVWIFGWIIIFEIIGYGLGKITAADIPWYASLNKSVLTPPGIAFSIVWSVLYAVLAIVAVFLWHKRNDKSMQPLYLLFFLQLIMNWAWTILFFHFHLIALSLVWIIVMVILNGIIITLALNRWYSMSYVLLPYFLWLIFATYLNGIIWLMN